MRRTRSRGGFTLVELMIALFIALFVVFVLGRVILTNQRAFAWNQDKMVLQQNVTETLEWLARSVRASRTLQVVSSTQFRTYDEQGNLTHNYQLITGPPDRLQVDGNDLVSRNCTLFTVTPDDDTTSVTIQLELEDDSSNRVAATTRAAVRNRTFEF